ncbi:GNAT family N-acetyltransferase [Robbsia sp. Bb-Pol-6]|uniref:GNAT family N-acetyltransferase n=2 Tax=Robbsia betulipollinis TaxID=2981849 RepID=A0ABT3ZJI3_9BURK|nr:GNAT family N-acetyltransferase [Robbsia betulipollinis]
MHAAVTYRPAVASDLPAICELGQSLNSIHHRARPDIYRDACSDPQRDSAHWEISLQGGDHAAFVAERASLAVGFITVQLSRPTSPLMQPLRFAQIRSVGVSDAQRGQGIGRALIGLAESWAVARGAAEVRLTVWTFNASAVRLYEELGYNAFALEMSKRATSIVASPVR